MNNPFCPCCTCLFTNKDKKPTEYVVTTVPQQQMTITRSIEERKHDIPPLLLGSKESGRLLPPGKVIPTYDQMSPKEKKPKRFRRSTKAASDIGYPAYGVTGPMKEKIPSPGDRKLAQSAQMYHYQHQKQQMIAMEKANGDMKHDASEDESDEDNVEGDYTVYECPGLAPTGEMEVKNPLFCGEEVPPTSAPPEYATPSEYQGHGQQVEGRHSPSSPSQQINRNQ